MTVHGNEVGFFLFLYKTRTKSAAHVSVKDIPEQETIGRYFKMQMPPTPAKKRDQAESRSDFYSLIYGAVGD